MGFKIEVKKVLSALLVISGAMNWKFLEIPKSDFFILMYHRILPKDKINASIESGMYVTLETFEEHLVILKDLFSVVTMEDIMGGEEQCGEYIAVEKHRCVITFDDGWTDFYDYAYPLLKKYKLPALVYLPTSFIGTKKEFWTETIASILNYNMSHHSKLTAVDNELLKTICAFKGTFESRFAKALGFLKKKPYFEISKMIQDATFLERDEKGRSPSFITWAQADEMLKSGLVSYGAHTVNHAILTNLAEKDVIFELNGAKTHLLDANVCVASSIPFCYPNGNYDDSIVSLVSKADYSTAVTTKFGWNYPTSDTFTLRRIGLHEDISSTKGLLLYRILSGYGRSIK